MNRVINSMETIKESGKRNYTIVLMITLLGIRATDISQMKRQDINWSKDTVSFIQNKTKESITLFIPYNLKQAILDYLCIRSDVSSPYLFTHLPKNGWKGKLSTPSISRIVHEAFVASGIDSNGRKSHAHVVRHSLACSMINEGVPLLTISGVLGHSSSEVTKKYAKIHLHTLRILTWEVPLHEGF